MAIPAIGAVVMTSLWALKVMSLVLSPFKLDTLSPTARHHFHVSLDLCCPWEYSPQVQGVQRTPCNITGTRVNYIELKLLDFLVFNLCNISVVGVSFFFVERKIVFFFSTPTDDATYSRLISSQNVVEHLRARPFPLYSKSYYITIE